MRSGACWHGPNAGKGLIPQMRDSLGASGRSSAARRRPFGQWLGDRAPITRSTEAVSPAAAPTRSGTAPAKASFVGGAARAGAQSG